MSDAKTRPIEVAYQALLEASKEPHSLPEISYELLHQARRSIAFWMCFEPADFYRPLGEAWSPADNVRHLEKSNRPVILGLRLPKLALRLMFGSADRPSRRFPEMVEAYRTELGAGASAGSFAPRPARPPAVPERAMLELLEVHRKTIDQLIRAIGHWSEASVDRLRLPHPVLGKLTVREMLLFTLYHNRHHVDNVARRVGIARPV